MAKAITFALLLAACFCAALARDQVIRSDARRMALAGVKTPAGWWYSLKTKSGMFCSLRDFPPKPDGYGTSRLYCITPSYNHYWMWRVTKVSGSGDLASGDEVYLTNYQPMLSYCKVSSQIVICGVASKDASKFVLEKTSGSGAINLTTDSVYFKAGGKYCGLVGTNHSQTLKCSLSAKSSATAFQLPASSYTAAALVSNYTSRPCGADFYPDFGTPNITCGVFNVPGFAPNLTIALGKPGAPVITGSNVTFKVYDDLYRYQVSNWRVNNKTQQAVFDENNTSGASQWFNMERLGGAATTGAFTNGTMIALKSLLNGQYCGLSLPQSPVKCDLSGPVASLPVGYIFRYQDGGWPSPAGTTADWSQIIS